MSKLPHGALTRCGRNTVDEKVLSIGQYVHYQDLSNVLDARARNDEVYSVQDNTNRVPTTARY